MGCLDIFRSESIPMSFVENKPAWQNPRNIRNVAYVALPLNNPIFLMPWLRSVLRDSKEQLVMPDRAGGRKILPSRTNHRKNYRHQRFLRGYPNRRSGTVCLAVPDGSLFRYAWMVLDVLLFQKWPFVSLCAFSCSCSSNSSATIGASSTDDPTDEKTTTTMLDYAWTQALGWRHVKSVTFLQLRLDEVSLGLITLVL